MLRKVPHPTPRHNIHACMHTRLHGQLLLMEPQCKKVLLNIIPPFHTVAVDFGDVSQFLAFPASSAVGTTICATFSIVDDNIIEPVESFMVTATGGSILGDQNTIQVSIQDNDGKEKPIHQKR